MRREGVEERTPAILQGKSISPFISSEIREKSRPVTFRTLTGSKASGYRADLLPQVCEVYLSARDADALPQNQVHVARQAEILVRGLAKVGIIALVDEATGYQDARARDALSKILEEFIAKELQPWVNTFPPEFYKEMFRLRGLPYPPRVRKPRYIGKLTNNLVYSRLAPGVLRALQDKNPVVGDSGRRKHKHFQWLTDHTGYQKLQQHLVAVTTLMKVSDKWGPFESMLDRALPKYRPLPLFDRRDES